MIGQPIFEEFRKILKDIPNIDSDEDFKRFALRSEVDSEVWTASILAMGNTLRNNLPVQHLVDQVEHHPREMKPSLLEVTEGKFDPEILAPIFSMYSPSCQRRGSNSSIRLFRWPGRRESTVLRYAHGSRPFILTDCTNYAESANGALFMGEARYKLNSSQGFSGRATRSSSPPAEAASAAKISR